MYEPILVALPERDRHGQLARMRDDLERRFGRRRAARGWPSECGSRRCRFDLADAGYEYTVFDDNHLRGASVTEDAMWGTYTTDDQGRLLTIFGTEKGLRYRIPWRPVDELIDYLRDNATEDGDRVGVMGDDGEKFGGVAGHVRAVLGQGGVGRPLLHGARGERVVAVDGDAGGLDGGAPAAGPRSTCPPRRTSR